MIISSLFKNIATLGFIGYLPIAPGTFGTFAALVFFALLKPTIPVHISLIIFVTAIGVIASSKAEEILNEKDSSHIVIDEFVGYALSILLLPHTLSFLAASFLLFRVFDILKPPPIRWIERTFPGGYGVMADDLVAGVYTNLVMRAWILLTGN
ncbi:MAG TPA: phosphatidylglycerophosphatase A [Thermodesulfovibrionales bacterium]|nr:phosphatidylglycerophosphatase A [Thermodesulfovibrionales bacterium]